MVVDVSVGICNLLVGAFVPIPTLLAVLITIPAAPTPDCKISLFPLLKTISFIAELVEYSPPTPT